MSWAWALYFQTKVIDDLLIPQSNGHFKILKIFKCCCSCSGSCGKSLPLVSVTHDLLMFLVLTLFSLSSLHSPSSSNNRISQGFLLDPILLYSMHPRGSPLNRLSAALFRALFYDKTANEFRKGVEVVDSLSGMGPGGQPFQPPISELPAGGLAFTAWTAQEKKFIPHWGNPFCFWVISKMEKFCDLPHCFYFENQNKHNLYCHMTSFRILTTIVISWNCFPFRIYHFLHLFLIW